jgi:hypothetical protein
MVAWQAFVAHVTVHDCVALHTMLLEQALFPQATVHDVPPQRMLLEHAPSPHWISQLAAFEQSMVLEQPPAPHCTTQGTPDGQVTVDEHLPPEQSSTHRPLASHAPFWHVCAEHAPPPGPPDELHAARTTSDATTNRRARSTMAIAYFNRPSSETAAQASMDASRSRRSTASRSLHSGTFSRTTFAKCFAPA